MGLRLRELFEHFGIKSFPKTSCSKGLQVYVPLNTPVSYDETKPFARAIAQLLESSRPPTSSNASTATATSSPPCWS